MKCKNNLIYKLVCLFNCCLCFISPMLSFHFVLIVSHGFGEVAETLPIGGFLLGRNQLVSV
jgi:hypothetical protein